VCASDRGPDEGWLTPSGTDAVPDLLADAGPVYLALAAGLDRAWDRHLAQAGDAPYSAERYEHVEYCVRTTIDGLRPIAALPEVAALIDGLGSLDEAGRSLEGRADDLAALVPMVMAQEVGPLADAVRARLGLRPRADDEAI
jgi:hypothetical protein